MRKEEAFDALQAPVEPTDGGGNSSVSDLSKRGYQLLKEDHLEEAMTCFTEILELDETNNYALVGLGDASRKMRKYHDAVGFYEQCLVHHPGNNYALFGLADCYKALNRFSQAIEIWEQYLEHDDRNVTVLTRVADAYRKEKNLRRSKEIYERALEIEADNPYALIGLGHLHYDFREYREALKYWSRMLEVHQDDVDIRVLTSIGNCHRKLKTFTLGIPFFKRALSLEPDNFYALFGLADCYRGIDAQEESLEYWLRILERDPENKVILTRTGDAYRGLADLDRAEEYYRKALNIEFDEYAILGLALINKSRGNYQDAIDSLKSLIANDAKNHRLYTEIADCELRLGRRDRAVEILSDFLKQGMRNSYVTDMLGKIRGDRRT
jgi:tetratricopeptide (TPR) repeat protein